MYSLIVLFDNGPCKENPKQLLENDIYPDRNQKKKARITQGMSCTHLHLIKKVSMLEWKNYFVLYIF